MVTSWEVRVSYGKINIDDCFVNLEDFTDSFHLRGRQVALLLEHKLPVTIVAGNSGWMSDTSTTYLNYRNCTLLLRCYVYVRVDFFLT